MDTDMQILKDISHILENQEVFFGYEDEKHISAGIIGAKKGHKLFKQMLDFYESDILTADFYTIPKLITHIVEKNFKKIDKNHFEGNITVYDKEYFYPFSYREDFYYECIKENTYGIHWWGKSWAKKRDYFLETKHLSGGNKIIKCAKIFARNTLITLKKRG